MLTTVLKGTPMSGFEKVLLRGNVVDLVAALVIARHSGPSFRVW